MRVEGAVACHGWVEANDFEASASSAAGTAPSYARRLDLKQRRPDSNLAMDGEVRLSAKALPLAAPFGAYKLRCPDVVALAEPVDGGQQQDGEDDEEGGYGQDFRADLFADARPHLARDGALLGPADEQHHDHFVE